MRLAEQDRNLEALAEYRAAVTVDPAFAMAHYRIAYTGEFGGLSGERSGAPPWRGRWTASIGSRPRSSPSSAWKAHLDGKDEEASRLYAEAARTWPQEKEVLYLAGDLLFHQNRLPEAIPFFERCAELNPTWEPALSHLSMALSATARNAEDLALTQRWVERAPGAAAHRQRANALADAGRLTEALASARRAYALEPSVLSRDYLGTILLANRAFGEAEALVRPAVEGREPMFDHDPAYMLHSGVLAQGRWREALAAIEPIRTRFPRHYHRLRARQFLCEAQPDRARAALDRFAPGWADGDGAQESRALIGQQIPMASVLAPRSQLTAALIRAVPASAGGPELDWALAAWRTGRADEAVTLLRPIGARSDLYQPLALYLVGELEAARDRHAEALAAMEAYQAHRDAAVVFISCRAWPRSLLVAASALEALGRRDEARARVDTLLDAWKRADADLPLLAQAKAMRARLATASK